jgi:site-specific DNA-methyltransferase (adenine-specific)
MTPTLMQGDTLEKMKDVCDGTVNLILCDLPFGTTNISWDIIIPFNDLWDAYRRVLAPGGCVLLFGNQPFTSRLILSNLAWYKQALVWNKNKCGSPGLAKIRPMQVHEDIVVFAPGRTVYNPQMEVGEPYARKTEKPEGYVGRVNNHGYGMKPRNGFTNDGTRYPKSIINISRDFSAQQQIHPAQKPVPLLEYLIRTYSNEGDTVMDNTMGSGSTGVAARNTNRNFIGIEKDPVFFNIAVQRVNAA